MGVIVRTSSRYRTAVHAVPQLVTAPILEPLTLTQAKLRAGLDWAAGDARDGLMTGFIAAARAKVEHDTGVALLTQTYDLLLDRMPASALLPLPWRPVQTVVVSYVTAAGVKTALDAGAVILDPSGAAPVPARVSILTEAIPADLRPFQPWILRCVVGFTTVALLEAAAPGLVHAVGLLTAHYATVGRDLAIVGTIVAETPQGYDEAIAPYELVTLA